MSVMIQNILFLLLCRHFLSNRFGCKLMMKGVFSHADWGGEIFLTEYFFLSAEEKISWNKVKILCMWTWLYALIWALFPILGWGRYGPEPFGLSCSLAWGQMKHEDFSFVISLFSMNLLMPSVIIIFCYFGIAVRLYFTYKTSTNCNHVPNIIKLHRRLLIVSYSFWWNNCNIFRIFVQARGQMIQKRCFPLYKPYKFEYIIHENSVMK